MMKNVNEIQRVLIEMYLYTFQKLILKESYIFHLILKSKYNREQLVPVEKGDPKCILQWLHIDE